MKRLNIWMFTLGTLLPGLALFPAIADDTELLFSAGSKPNVLFILDSSGSMYELDSADESRLKRLKNAMHSLIGSAENMNIGVMRFNGSGGNVVYPFTALGSTVAAYTIDGVARSVMEYNDNATEQLSGDIYNLADATLRLSENNVVGLRFTDITIPKGHAITSAYLELTASYSYYQDNEASVTITAQDHDNPPAFESNNKNITNRASIALSEYWGFTPWSSGEIYRSEDLKLIISALTSRANWQSGNSIVLKLTDINGSRIAIASHSLDGAAAKLIIETAPIDMPERQASDAILDAVDQINAYGSTPVVNALYEGVRYLMGETVDIGLNRGAGYTLDKAFARPSHSGSYTNGTDTLPTSTDPNTACSSYDLNSENCISQSITAVADVAPQYISPISETCQADNNYVILLTDGDASTISPKKDAIETLTGSSCSGTGFEQCGTTLAKFINTGDLRTDITSMINSGKLFTIGFNYDGTWLESLANPDNGGGAYYTASSSANLLDSFDEIFASILDIDTTFSSVGVSVNSYNKLSHRNELYFSLFKPKKTVQWDGNLKRYKLSSSGQIIDATGALAVDQSTGFFKTEAKSYWSAIADGSEVKDGGAASNLEGSTRNVYTYLDSVKLLTATSNEVASSNTALTKSMFGLADTATSAQLTSLINFTRGQDEEGDSKFKIYDPLHSTPFIVNYGSNKESSTTVVYFGDNQGMLHAIDSSTGEENWAFIPQELLENQLELSENAELTSHIYGLDGDITGWEQATSSSGSKKYLYVGMRRGGSSYYAFDITSKDSPEILWTISSTDSDFSELGQSWSKPIKTKIKINGVAKDVLIFAGGYDSAQDNKLTRSADSMGRAIYIVDAESGARLWWGSASGATETFSKMIYSIPSNIKVIDADLDGFADQMYVGDMGGQLWRFDIDNANNSVSSLIKGGVIADLNGGSAETNRRFYHTPDISMLEETVYTTSGKKTTSELITLVAVAIGSGYQAHPLNTTIEDRFYLIKTDLAPPNSYSALSESGDLMDVTGGVDDAGNTITIDLEVLQSKKGWYIDLKGNSGEKVLAPSRTANNEIWFTTFEPEPQLVACVVTPGVSRLYRINLIDGSPSYNNTIPDDTPDDDGVKPVNSCDQVECDINDRSMKLKTGALPLEPIILKINGKKLIAVGKEIMKFDTVKTKSMYWTDKE